MSLALKDVLRDEAEVVYTVTERLFRRDRRRPLLEAGPGRQLDDDRPAPHALCRLRLLPGCEGVRARGLAVRPRGSGRSRPPRETLGRDVALLSLFTLGLHAPLLAQSVEGPRVEPYRATLGETVTFESRIF